MFSVTRAWRVFPQQLQLLQFWSYGHERNGQKDGRKHCVTLITLTLTGMAK